MFPLLVLTSLQDNLCDMAFLGRLYAGVTSPSGHRSHLLVKGVGGIPQKECQFMEITVVQNAVSFRRQPIG